MPQPSPACKGDRVGTPACGPALRGLVGAIGWSSASPPVRRGCRFGRAPRAPLLDIHSNLFGGVGPRELARFGGGAPGSGLQTCYLVDSASSHMLVSKIKPCMSKYKHFIL